MIRLEQSKVELKQIYSRLSREIRILRSEYQKNGSRKLFNQILAVADQRKVVKEKLSKFIVPTSIHNYYGRILLSDNTVILTDRYASVNSANIARNRLVKQMIASGRLCKDSPYSVDQYPSVQ